MKKSLLIIVIALFAFSAMAQKIEISPEIIPGLTGQEITVSVIVSEFDTETTSLGAIEFYIDFDNSVLSYTGVTNFSPLLPVSQWFYSNPSPALNRFACNWAEPTLQNVSIPTGTVLFDLKFLCANGQTVLDFDSAASVFVHIDGVNFVSLPVDFSNGFVQINVGIAEQNNEKYIIATGDKNFVIRNIEGQLTVTNLMGQTIINTFVSETEERNFSINQSGIFVVRVANKHQEITRKIFIY